MFSRGLWSSSVRRVRNFGSAGGARKFFLNIITNHGLEIAIFDANFGKALGEDRGFSGWRELLVDYDQAFCLENAEPSFKIPFLVANGDTAVRSESFKFLENLFLGHTFSQNAAERITPGAEKT
jgi:hypothetical protein